MKWNEPRCVYFILMPGNKFWNGTIKPAFYARAQRGKVRGLVLILLRQWNTFLVEGSLFVFFFSIPQLFCLRNLFFLRVISHAARESRLFNRFITRMLLQVTKLWKFSYWQKMSFFFRYFTLHRRVRTCMTAWNRRVIMWSKKVRCFRLPFTSHEFIHLDT